MRETASSRVGHFSWRFVRGCVSPLHLQALLLSLSGKRFRMTLLFFSSDTYVRPRVVYLTFIDLLLKHSTQATEPVQFPLSGVCTLLLHKVAIHQASSHCMHSFATFLEKSSTCKKYKGVVS